jgi:aminopeptidase N
MSHKAWDRHSELTLEIGSELGFWDEDKSKKHKSFHLPGAEPHYNPDRPGQVGHISLDLNLDIIAESIAGTCKIRLRPVRDGIKDLTLDAVALRIDSVAITNQIEAKPDPEKRENLSLVTK